MPIVAPAPPPPGAIMATPALTIARVSCVSATPHDPPRVEAESSFALVLRARRGDQPAIEELCARYLPRLNRWAHGRLPGYARGALETQDLVQDTLVQVVSRLDQFEPRHEGAFQAYARQALLNRIRDQIRHATRKPAGDPIDDVHEAADPSPLEEAIGQQALERYEAALQRLRPEDREAVIARVEMRLSMADIAAALGKPSAAAAHMAVSRALVRLADEMSRGTER